GSIVGAMLPFILKRIKLDPATSSAPFVATLVDVTGIVIYLTVAMAFLRTALLAPPLFDERPIASGEAVATVRSVLADPRGRDFWYLEVQTDEQQARHEGTKIQVPLEGLPDGQPPKVGARIRVHL